jgi:hypothetical protein
VICGGKAHLEPPLALRSFGTPPRLSTTAPHKGPDCPYTVDDATMQPCGADCPASLYHLATNVSASASSWGFSTVC